MTQKLSAYTVNIGGVPIGCSIAYSGSGTIPAGYLLCNGAAVSRTTYANLYSAIGTVYGTGDGSTTFNLPDYRGAFLRGYDGTRSAAIGTAQADGLPEIAGSFFLRRLQGDFLFSRDTPSGAFQQGNNGTSVGSVGSGGTTFPQNSINFIASLSNSIYGSSSYVTPYNYAVQYIIKY